ncbi:riboflavin synthase [Pseudalkalibacillus hwajinpoensis]|uniref:Riboflavin synthase n=1 Tax=Guptibacillus hwajinpoensis TaxID=208199 RepID=A0A4U1MGR3_9BACL|nr:riboflavin synthase [Pseudalkalibacillus hwajinpoensis]TKD69907.1 riboflavin synthase [Pseudalkalibacillus hwajinpoensis]
MFTGIVEEIGRVESVQQAGESIVMQIAASTVLKDVHLGDSISINGVCLTVTSFTNSTFTVDIMPETFKSTALRHLGPNSSINLERAMAANGRFGGHFVSGHVDGVGEITRVEKVENAVYYDISISRDLIIYFVEKGSVSIDGTSLTVFGIGDHSLTISLIPHTVEETVLGRKRVGDLVNIECDMLGKYIMQYLDQRNGSKPEPASLGSQFYEEHGFK